jgi:hypothetical protein
MDAAEPAAVSPPIVGASPPALLPPSPRTQALPSIASTAPVAGSERPSAPTANSKRAHQVAKSCSLHASTFSTKQRAQWPGRAELSTTVTPVPRSATSASAPGSRRWSYPRHPCGGPGRSSSGRSPALDRWRLARDQRVPPAGREYRSLRCPVVTAADRLPHLRARRSRAVEFRQ